MQIFRHGDLPVTPVDAVAGTLIKHSGSVVLALGETTGHKHVLTVARPMDMMVYDIGAGLHMVKLTALGTLTHEEHGTIELPPGKYRVGREREFDHFAKSTRQVID